MKNAIIFDDKAKTYEVYGKYYKRDLIEIFESGEAEEKKFVSLVSKHPKFISKPFDGACGIGIKIINVKVEEARARLKELLKEYPRGFVAEELIVQTGILHDIHPESVNTLRMPTIKEDRTEVIHPILRCGRGSAVVDNGGAGGICCAIDVETGIVKSAFSAFILFQITERHGFTEEIEKIVHELGV